MNDDANLFGTRPRIAAAAWLAGIAAAVGACAAFWPTHPTTAPPDPPIHARPSSSANAALSTPVSNRAAPAPRFEKPPGSAPAGMVWIPAGSFVMGDDKGQPDERPAHPVTLDGFWMDRTEVTNTQFKEFVDAAAYVTVAERTPKREDFRGVIPDVRDIPAANLVPGSICFNERADRRLLDKNDPLWPYAVWKYVKGASWMHPDGPGSSIADRMQHPVVHVSWDDVQAYCKWAGKRLPTEAEWEYAARGGLPGATYPWGNELERNGKWMLNIWQGEFPGTNELKDGFATTAPVASFAPNAFGLFDMSGNVWEWCGDFYRPDYYEFSPSHNPPGPADSIDPLEPQFVKRVQRGGSFMCSDNYCRGYRVAARMKGTPDSGAYHTGFRCVLSPATGPSGNQGGHDTTPRN